MKLFLGAAAVASIGRSSPASVPAQDRPPPGAVAGPLSYWTLDRRELWVGERIARASDRGHLPGAEQSHGIAALQALRVEHARLAQRDGGALNELDRDDLVRRIDDLNDALRWDGVDTPPWAVPGSPPPAA